MKDRYVIVKPIRNPPVGKESQVAVVDLERGMVVSYCSDQEATVMVQSLNNPQPQDDLTCQHNWNPNEVALIDSNERTSCCNAAYSVFIDDESLYCKCCYATCSLEA